MFPSRETHSKRAFTSSTFDYTYTYDSSASRFSLSAEAQTIGFYSFYRCTNHFVAMNSLVAQIQPPPRRPQHDDEYTSDPAAWGSMGGYGNLSRTGGIDGMSVPRVSDVRPLVRRLMSHLQLGTLGGGGEGASNNS